MKEVILIFLVAGTGSLFTNCDSYIAEKTDSVYMDYDYQTLGYKLFEPADKFFLSYKLEEISGLSYYKDNMLAAVEDEEGILYLVEANSGKIKRQIVFEKSGDYEGIEILNEKAYIIRSDGDIFEFDMTNDEKVESTKTETILSNKNNAEGLGVVNGQLSIALKGTGDTDDNKTKGKAIYSYDRDKKELVEKETISIDEADLNKFIKSRQYFNKLNDFDPSGIAQHPITKDIYIISADKILIVLKPTYELKEVIKLHPTIYNQAEGICFAPNGTLFISSEGDGGKGKIMKINYVK